MKPTTSVLLIVLALLGATNAFFQLTPWDKEVIYNWQALVKAGTFLPAHHASQFVLNGKIHLQSNDKYTFVKITNMTYQLYNGIMDHEHENNVHTVPVPSEVEPLTHPFKIVYDTKGLAAGIGTEENEMEFSRNIKKAIATILQMDESVLKATHPYAFVRKEDSIYGKFDVDYSIMPHENGMLEVFKRHHMKHNNHLYQLFFSNVMKKPCSAIFEHPIMHTSKKMYQIVKQDNQQMVKHINSMGYMVYYPYKGKSDAQYMMVNQTFELVETVSVKEKIHMDSAHFEDSLMYNAFEDMDDGSVFDVTNGHRVVNHEKLITSIKLMLKDIHEYLQENHIDSAEPDSKRGQLINRVQRLMQMIGVEKLKELYGSLSGVSLEVFYRILPLVGTKASTWLIKELIVTKATEENVAVVLLQNFPEYVIEPTVHLITELEPLMNLPDTISWKIRETAILSFATLIYRSSVYAKKMKQNELMHQDVEEEEKQIPLNVVQKLQEPYEKYVVEYVTKMKSSSDYKVQMAYILGLDNMKLVSIIKHLMPVVNGEWTNDFHLRFLSLIAVGSLVDEDTNPDTIIEIFWPIFTNRHELQEMRMAAHHYIFKSHPSHSMLMNLNEFMLSEENEELYHYHYTYLESIIHSNDPCKEESRVKSAQMLKFLPPPSHGLSYVQVSDYQDPSYGFSGSITNYLFNTNHSRLYGFAVDSQDSSISHEEYQVYVKIHGAQYKNLIPTSFSTDMFKEKLPKITDPSGLHIEVVIFKHDQAISSYYFNEENLKELNNFVDYFSENRQLMNKDMVLVDYHMYSKMLIPTDLGIPAVWETLVPVVMQNKFGMSNEVTNKVVNVHITNKYVSWVHYRHGLSFYNPIADVWQGINRYNSYDAVLPMTLDITINTQQLNFQVSWKKNPKPEMNVAGLRSHVKQMVFVKDDYNKNILQHSCSQCKDFVVVGFDKQFRNDYTLVDTDDLNTGLKYMVRFYDSSRHISNGSIDHQTSLLLSPETKQFNSPLEYFWMSYYNWLHFVMVLPKPGTYGYMVRMQPTTKFPVTRIDLSARLNFETIDDSFFYSPARKWSARMTYAIKNQEQNIKTWDVTAMVDLNAGHSVNNLKMHLTRIVPGKPDYKICVDGVKKWVENKVTGHVNVAMGETPDGKCIKDDTVVDVTMTGQLSEAQLSDHHKYGACQYIVPYTKPHNHTMECLMARSTVRDYTYNVKTTNVPQEFKKMLLKWWDYLKASYFSYYQYEPEHNDDIGEHNFKVNVVYPMEVDEVDVQITTPQQLYSLTGVPMKFWKWFGIYPDSLAYSQWFEIMHQHNFVDHCMVYPDHHVFNNYHHHEVISGEWTLYVGNVAQNQNPTKAIYVKKISDNKIAVKAVDAGHVMEIVPHGEIHQITLDGQVVSGEYHKDTWVYYQMFKHDHHHPVAAVLPKSGIHFEYDTERITVVIPKVKEELHGHCYMHH